MAARTPSRSEREPHRTTRSCSPSAICARDARARPPASRRLRASARSDDAAPPRRHERGQGVAPDSFFCPTVARFPFLHHARPYGRRTAPRSESRRRSRAPSARRSRRRAAVLARPGRQGACDVVPRARVSRGAQPHRARRGLRVRGAARLWRCGLRRKREQSLPRRAGGADRRRRKTADGARRPRRRRLRLTSGRKAA